MSHDIDMTLNRPAIAYTGEAPWHRLGARLNPDDPIEVWRKAAGLDWEVRATMPHFYDADGFSVPLVDHRVLTRTDTEDVLSLVSDEYRVVQPSVVMDFFAQLVKLGGFQMECAGALNGGRRIWALAKVNDGAPIIAGDTVLPYVLLATSYDGSMATTARLTGIRVVCRNTLDLSEWARSGSVVRVTHLANFDPKRVRMDLGIYADGFEQWLIKARRMTAREITLNVAGNLTVDLLSTVAPKEATEADIRQMAGFKRVMELFDGEAMGSDMAGPTVWGWLNAVTEWVDHERGRLGAERRFASSMMGAGNNLKNIAQAKASELV